MNADDELGAAYDRLAGALAPPEDARERIAGGVRSRRRRRAAGAGALAVAVVLGLGGYAVAQGDGGRGPDRTPVVTDPSEPAEPTETDAPESLVLTCAGDAGQLVFPAIDNWGGVWHDLPEDAVAGWRDEAAGDRLVMEQTGPHTMRVAVVRADGTTRALADLRESRAGWWPESLRICPEDLPGSDVEAVTLVVGHCYVEPVSYDGWLWGLPRDDQFGAGGPAPVGLVGSGTVSRSGDRLRYVDVGGPVLWLVRSDDARFFDPAGAPCF